MITYARHIKIIEGSTSAKALVMKYIHCKIPPTKKSATLKLYLDFTKYFEVVRFYYRNITSLTHYCFSQNTSNASLLSKTK